MNDVRCSNCGAVLPPGDVARGACHFCGAAVRLPAAPRSPGDFEAQPRGPSRGGSGAVAAVIAVVVVLAVAASVAAVVLSRAPPRKSAAASDTEAVTPPRAEVPEPAVTTPAASAASAKPAKATGPQPLFDFGGKGDGPGLFNDAREIAVDGEGFLYVADYGTGRIQKFDSNGKYIELFQLEPTKNQTNQILDMVATGHELVVVHARELVRLSTADGKRLGVVPPPTPHATYRHIAVDQGGDLFALSVDEDPSKGAITKFDKNGKVLGRWPRKASADDMEVGSDRLAVTGSGAMFVLRAHGLYVEALDPKGELLNRIGQKGDGPGEFKSFFLCTLAADARGHVLVMKDWDLDVFDTGGRYRGRLGLHVNIRGFALGQDDRLYVTANPEHVFVYKLDPDAVDALGH